MRSGKKREKKGDVYDFMLLWQEVETFKKKHKIIDVPFFFSSINAGLLPACS
jgi:hypothetical protein